MKGGFFLLFMFCFVEGISQSEEIDIKLVNDQLGPEVYELPPGKKELQGDIFLFENWTVGNINLKSGKTISNIPIKYNILNQELVMMKDGRLMGVKLNFVNSFNLLSNEWNYIEFFVNNDWTIDLEPRNGIYQKLSEIDEYGLIKVTKVVYVEKAQSQHYASIDTGQKDGKYEKKEFLYFLNTSTKNLDKVPRSKKKLIEYFGREDISSFIKTYNIDFKSEVGLINLVDHINSSSSTH